MCRDCWDNLVADSYEEFYKSREDDSELFADEEKRFSNLDWHNLAEWSHGEPAVNIEVNFISFDQEVMKSLSEMEKFGEDELGMGNKK